MKKIMAGILITAVAASTVVFAAPVYKSLQVSYDVNLEVNNSNYFTSDTAKKPFVTADGRTFVSIAALKEMDIATVAYDSSSKTVSIKSKSNSSETLALQSQVSSLVGQNTTLTKENADLKAEIETLKKGSSSSSNSSGDSLSKITSSERIALTRDLELAMRDIRAYSVYSSRGQRFDASVSIRSSAVTIDFTPYGGGDMSTDEKNAWNDLYNSNSKYDYLVADFTDFTKDVHSEVESVLKGYSGYTMDVNVYADEDATKLIVEGAYNSSRDKYYCDIYKAS